MTYAQTYTSTPVSYPQTAVRPRVQRRVEVHRNRSPLASRAHMGVQRGSARTLVGRVAALAVTLFVIAGIGSLFASGETGLAVLVSLIAFDAFGTTTLLLASYILTGLVVLCAAAIVLQLIQTR